MSEGKVRRCMWFSLSWYEVVMGVLVQVSGFKNKGSGSGQYYVHPCSEKLHFRFLAIIRRAVARRGLRRLLLFFSEDPRLQRFEIDVDDRRRYIERGESATRHAARWHNRSGLRFRPTPYQHHR